MGFCLKKGRISSDVVCSVDNAAVLWTGCLHDCRDGDDRNQCYHGYDDCYPRGNIRCDNRQSDVPGFQEGTIIPVTSGFCFTFRNFIAAALVRIGSLPDLLSGLLYDCAVTLSQLRGDQRIPLTSATRTSFSGK